jgi:hypothetical protein
VLFPFPFSDMYQILYVPAAELHLDERAEISQWELAALLTIVCMACSKPPASSLYTPILRPTTPFIENLQVTAVYYYTVYLLLNGTCIQKHLLNICCTVPAI